MYISQLNKYVHLKIYRFKTILAISNRKRNNTQQIQIDKVLNYVLAFDDWFIHVVSLISQIELLTHVHFLLLFFNIILQIYIIALNIS
jgi:hypothetical protein